ncbi:MAG: MMPL family transporter, partial [Longimicrobiales bacterium]
LRIITEERAQYGRVSAGVFTRSESPALVLTDSQEEVAEVVARVEEIIATDTLSPTVGSVESILSVLPSNQSAKLETIGRLRNLVDDEAVGLVSGEDGRRIDRLLELLQVDEPFQWTDFPEKDRERFADNEGDPGNFVLIYPEVALRDGRNAMAFRDDIGVVTSGSGNEYRAASTHLINADMLSMITSEGPIALGLALAMVFLAAAVFFRSAMVALFIISPTVVGILWMGGAMQLLGMQLNFFNLVVFPSIVGIGDDNGVHIYHRYRAEGPGSLPFVLRRTGAAISMTSATTMVGYSGLITAQHPGLQSIGILAVIGLLSTYIAAVVLLPAFLEVFDSGAKAPEPS